MKGAQSDHFSQSNGRRTLPYPGGFLLIQSRVPGVVAPLGTDDGVRLEPYHRLGCLIGSFYAVIIIPPSLSVLTHTNSGNLESLISCA